MSNDRKYIKKAAFTAVMAALGCVLAYVPRLFSADGAARLDLAILPILLVAQMCGPLWSGAGYVLTDLVGCLFSGYAPFFPITVCKLVAGVLLGFGAYQRKFTDMRFFLSLVFVAAVVDFGMMSVALRWLQGRPWVYYMWVRPLTAVMNLAVRALFAPALAKAAAVPLARMKKHFE